MAREGRRPPRSPARTGAVVGQGDVLAPTRWSPTRPPPPATAFTTAGTLLGVARLGFTGRLVELDLTAALPDPVG
ncbi:hypothetical protein [Nonomuraea rhodomycinica]|uniref:hypothetical protein n=1 Tax=Nonomuraea rhodomycinica TaxID=1712872 RepID=UPI001C37B3A1|nr:hypothetical protein [Nonomuraea rhodomycinica]